MIIIGQVSGIEDLEGVFKVTSKLKEEPEKQFALYPQDDIITVTTSDRHSFINIKYGLIPFWQSSSKMYATAPIDGETIQPESEGIKARIINIPAFRKPIRENRCIIPVDYFILEENGQASVFFFENRPFALAGIFDAWKQNLKDKELYYGASILTLPAQGIIRQAGFSRQPFILDQKFWKPWINENPLIAITSMFSHYPDQEINGYPINREKVYKQERAKHLIMPSGEFYQDRTKDKLEKKSLLKYRKGLARDMDYQIKSFWTD